MADDWWMPLGGTQGSPLPPLTNPEDDDPKSADWQKAIAKEIRARQTFYPGSLNVRYEITAATATSSASLPVSGTNPGPWKEIGRKDDGDKDYILWQRVYPSVNFQRYTILTVTFTLVSKSPIAAINPDKVLGSQPLPPPLVFWIKKGKPYAVKDAVFHKWEESSVHRTAADGKKSYIEVRTPPNDDPDFPGVPAPDGGWDDPKKELRVARAEFRSDGVLVALGLTIKDAEGRPLDGVSVTLEDRLCGITAANGGLEIIHFVARPPDDAVALRAADTANTPGASSKGRKRSRPRTKDS